MDAMTVELVKTTSATRVWNVTTTTEFHTEFQVTETIGAWDTDRKGQVRITDMSFGTDSVLLEGNLSDALLRISQN